MEYNINPKFETIDIKNVDEVSIYPYMLTKKADIHVRYVTEEFIKDLYNKLAIDLKPKTMGGKRYYVFKVDGMETNITFWVR